MSETETELPAIGDEVAVCIVPSLTSDKYWKQLGNLLTVRQDPSGLVIGTIQVTRQMTDEGNPNGRQTDVVWCDCIVAAVFNPFSNDWRATCPASDSARAVWAKCWATESGS